MSEIKRTEQAMSLKQEVRCECGSLVAKLVESGVELKCRRCKRLALILFARFKGGTKTVTVQL